ncbi:HAD family hydrolase [Corynebacterium bovis]|uniref:HAD-IB family hydrolase n=2 Tax=Corynebacterium bovis TaxID=36808 RepID=A0A426Q3D2_9CORY|nr:HAD-IB family hydrolase [Corynebacterium bovis]RRO91979.1 HAD-IB family hydrolase [Corynebacterium bovis]RRO96776.1 HAD-IB family hydrolase [Corynebacterium bovis]RRO97947.1 HAD-IB family hydrolase [Corynebacterium bovis]RRQ01069.1 HAD-IB family hydrolase [Corynebacterium bovis]RRQ01622.1 HAD-IB family hydrolase [Corynebacterium bovis]
MSDPRSALTGPLTSRARGWWLPVSRGGLRRVLRTTVFRSRGETAQRMAGQASAELALGSLGAGLDALYADVTTGPVVAGSSDLAVVDLTVTGDDGDASAADGDTPAADAPGDVEDVSGEDAAALLAREGYSTDDASFGRLARTYGVEGHELRTGLRTVGGARDAAGGTNRLNTPDPLIPQDAGAAAFFDVDNTLIQGASILLFARGLVRHRFFSVSQVLDFIWMQLKFRVSGEEDLDDVAEGREHALSIVAGRSVAEVTELAEDIWQSRMAGRIFPETRALAEMHLQAGHDVWLVTATPVQLAQIIARELGFTGALGTVAEVRDGVFTGRLVGDILHGAGKRHAVAALAAYEKLDLSRCTAYSDSINDIPMLSMVGTAVAVNPDSRLRETALANGWEVLDYRGVRGIVRRFGPVAAAGALAVGGLGLVGAVTTLSLRRRSRLRRRR